jgi:hypothetical protein
MSLLPADTPRMPKWPFLAGDALLLGLALAIGCYAHNPFAGKSLILIVACIALGAVLGTWPFIADYESKRNEALDERQRGLEALAHTVTSSAEQISIAAQSLPGIAEAVTKSLKSVEQLPARLQEKTGEINQRLAAVSVAKKESSAAEHAESERLAITADHIRQAVTELAKFEAAAQKNLSAAGDKLDAKAAQIFKQLDAKIAALSALAEKFSASPEPARGESLDKLGTLSLSNGPVESAERADAAPLPEEKPVRTRVRKEPFRQAQGPEPVEWPEVSPSEPVHSEPIESVKQARPEPVEPAGAEKPAIIEPIVIETPAEEPKASRKRTAARKEPEAPSGEPARPELVEPVASVEPAVEEKPAIVATARGEPARPEPFRQAQGPEPVEGLAERVKSTVIDPPAEESKTPRKRAQKKSKGEDTEPSLDFDASAKGADASPTPSSSPAGDEFSQASPDEAGPATAVSADGATRLLVTAYIGIGNKLFLRGDGPGLSWDEGVPLQFVSIGKWRWETADATKPVHAKLYKNDEIVCASLGKFTLDPGQQAEVTAAF